MRRSATYTISGKRYTVRQFDGVRGPALFFRLGREAGTAIKGNLSGIPLDLFEAVRDAVVAETTFHMVTKGADGAERTVPVPLSGVWGEHFEGDSQGDLFVLIAHALELNYARFLSDTLWPSLTGKLIPWLAAKGFAFPTGSIGSPGDSVSTEAAP